MSTGVHREHGIDLSRDEITYDTKWGFLIDWIDYTEWIEAMSGA